MAVVGETESERLALGAASGACNVSRSSRVSGWPGQRRATVPPPAVTTSGICRPRGTTTVSGPGQSAAVSFAAVSGHEAASPRAIASSATWTMSGFVAGLPFAAKIRSTASASVATAARP